MTRINKQKMALTSSVLLRQDMFLLAAFVSFGQLQNRRVLFPLLVVKRRGEQCLEAEDYERGR